VRIHSNTTGHKKHRCTVKSVTREVPGKRESNNHEDRECDNVLPGTAEVVMIMGR
jgi:hypothetical protein